MAAIITLLTDFGYQDSYVGVIKGVIAGICPEAQTIDLSHGIPPQSIAAARFALLSAYGYFPKGTVHLVVVDPGVGTARRAIAVQTPTAYLIGPDNGVLSGVLDEVAAIAAVSLTESAYWLTASPSGTFHGRDVFAPVAAHLATGVPLTQLGTKIEPKSLLRIGIPKPEVQEDCVVGHVQHTDHFGNIITTIPAQAVTDGDWKIQVDTVEMPLCAAYGEVAIGHALALVGSHGWVEIAVNGSSAQQRFRLVVGDEIQLVRHYRE